MEFDKKILVLKQVTEGFSVTGKAVSGIFRLELENGVATFSLSVINLSTVDGGSYYLFIMDDKRKLYSYELGKRPFSQTKVMEACPSIKKGLSVGISFIKDDLPTLVCFAAENVDSADMVDFKKAIVDKCISERRKFKCEIKPAPTQNGYDDEVVATENYFQFDDELNEKISLIERLDDEYVRSENGKSANRSEKTANEELSCCSCVQNETDVENSEKYKTATPYYRKVKPELDALFCKFPSDEGLCRAVKESKWIRVYYSENKYYVVGVVKEHKKEKYVCYGVPAKYSPDPPEELKGFCSFIPLSVFDLKGDGYWMMFQDAVTGECVKINR